MFLFHLNLTVNSCRSLIFDVVVKFSSEVAEDDIISLIQKAVLVGNLGVLSVHVSYVTLNPHGAQTTVTSPTNTDPKSGVFLVF